MSLLLAHRDRRHFDGQPSLSGYSGRGRAGCCFDRGANDPKRRLRIATRSGQHGPTAFTPQITVLTRLGARLRELLLSGCLQSPHCARDPDEQPTGTVLPARSFPAVRPHTDLEALHARRSTGARQLRIRSAENASSGGINAPALSIRARGSRPRRRERR